MVGGFTLFLSLLNNLFLFIALVALYGYLQSKIDDIDAIKRQLIMGVLFGIFSIGCMYARIPVFEGVIVDQRNAIVALSGAFGGPLSALISAVMTGGFRAYLGGSGVLAGVVGVFLAGSSGVLVRRLPFRFTNGGNGALSSLIAVLIILPGFLLVGDIHTGWNLMKAMALPYGLAIFLGILLVGLLLQRQDERLAYKKSSQYSADLETANRNLKRTLEDLEFTRDRLVEARKMEALGLLVSGIAHEINTPLGIGITGSSYVSDKTLGFLETVKGGGVKKADVIGHLEALLPMTEQVVSSLTKVSKLVSDFKLMAADKQGELVHHFNLIQYLEAIIASFSQQLAERRCSVEVSGDSAIEIDSFPGGWASIISQLIENSISHGFDGRKTGWIGISVALEGDEAVIRYSDDGIGMDATTRAKIFDPFFTTARVSGRAGLGLSIIYNLVTQKLKGRIEVDSDRGEGTRFSIYVPMTNPLGD